MPAPQIIHTLVERFEQNIESYKSGNYNETQARQEFINPFFEALGWDISNTRGYAEAYKDVVHEYSQKTSDSVEAPDYLFKIGGIRKFFVEAKKPSVNLKDDFHPAFQLRRYAWSAKLPLSVLTDFEEFSIYDCRFKPEKTDKPSNSRIRYYNYKEYVQHWDQIESIFSRDAVLKGSFDKFAETNKKVKGGQEVDDAFLKEIESWREQLAKNIALRNPDLSNRELNFAVQKTIDRIIFLRICEDRGIEDYGELMALQNGVNIYARLLQKFKSADDKYNSGLFHFKDEKNRPGTPDDLTTSLNIDDKVLKDIFKNLYYPECPYEFSVLGADILGQVYEQFLGKVIRLTAGHMAKVEDKPEVKKAGGVYYTPTYIVNYIVKNTVGKLVENKKPKQVEKLKILDPACGSGSFLLGAYQFLLDWHLNYYTIEENPEILLNKKESPVYVSESGEYKLTTSERKRILLNNIFGVDIDSQAVEVTKLSLLLKVLEGETEQSLTNQLSMFKQRALPDLADNIKCGNSLIGPDFYDQMEMKFLDEEEKLRINVFDWNAEFKEIMNSGGFDAVIGNPPYVKIQNLQEFNPETAHALKKNYVSAQKGSFDIYIVFIERGLNLLCKNGFLGFIVPHKFFNSNYGEDIRKFLYKEKVLNMIVHFNDVQIFNKATTYTCLLFLQMAKNNSVLAYKFSQPKLIPEELENIPFSNISIDNFGENSWSIVEKTNLLIMEKLKHFKKLGEICSNIFQGPKSGADNVFILKCISSDSDKKTFYSSLLEKEVVIENSILKKYIKGKFIRNYFINYLENEYHIFPYDNKGNLYSLEYIKKSFPHTYSYLTEKTIKDVLQLREHGRFKQNYWSFSRPQNMSIIFDEKILTPFNAFTNSFAYDKNKDFVFSAGVSGAYGIKIRDEIELDYFYLLGILNSKVTWFFITNTSTSLRGGFYSFENKYIKNIPIPLVNTNNSKSIAEITKTIPDLKQKLLQLKTPQEKTALQRQIDAAEKQIDKLVYELYDLTEDEIKIVESS